MRKVLILEDQEETRKALTATVKRVETGAVVFAVGTLEQAYAIAMQHTIHLFLLDIILKPGDKYRDNSGVDFAQNIREVSKYRFTPIIFLTSLYDAKLTMYSHIHCYKFIEKPYDYREVEDVVRETLDYPILHGKAKRYFYRCEGLLESVIISQIIYVESESQGLHVITKEDERHIPYKTLKSIRKEMDVDLFLQCNRKTLVNISYIKSIDPANRYVYLKECEDVLEIGPIMKKNFLSELKLHSYGI